MLSLFYGPTLTSIHDYWKNHSFDYTDLCQQSIWVFVGKVMSLLFNMLSRFVIAFLPRSKRLLISLLQSPCAVILEPQKVKSLTVSIVSPSICHEGLWPDTMILVSWKLSFKPDFSLSSFTFHQEGLEFLFAFYHKRGVICIPEVIDISPHNLDSSLCFIQSGILHFTSMDQIK